jgi:predicted MPP superfamily phosphohydrolase
MGVWGVMGDYDYSNSRKSCLFCHEPNSKNPATVHQVHFLNHSREKLSLPGGDVWIGGVDTNAVHSLGSKKGLDLPNGDRPAIILSHSPFTFDQVDESYGVLILAGDTHGGQIALPHWVWKISGYEKTSRFSRGLFKKGKKTMYVNTGLGTSHVPMRFLRRPEIAVLHF